jgi:Arc/MetJ-type ribon-helix-helix transcriptional regulator
MVRTQIYLTEAEQEALRSLARDTGRYQSELIREAIDEMLERQEPVNRRALMRQARGMWSDRDDLPDLKELRDEFDRTVKSA